MLNHHHLYHFWSVVREGGVTRASEKLHVSQPTISGQLRELEEALGEKLLVRSGRTVALTDIGRTVYRSRRARDRDRDDRPHMEAFAAVLGTTTVDEEMRRSTGWAAARWPICGFLPEPNPGDSVQTSGRGEACGTPPSWTPERSR